MSDSIKDFESLYPTVSTEFKKIQQEQYELFAKKMVAYGLGNIALGTPLEAEEDKKLSLTGIWLRCNDKINRLRNLLVKGRNNHLDNEPTEDAWIDLSNYGIIALLVGRDKWKK